MTDPAGTGTETVFGNIYASQYDWLYEQKDYGGECDLLEQAFLRFAGRDVVSLLDVGCGTGRHLIEMARRGYRTTGVDVSAAMLEHARVASAVLAANSRPAFVHGDARSFDVGGTFDAAVMLFAVIGYLTTNDDVLGALSNIRRHLRDGGLFVCDFWYGPAVLSERPGERTRTVKEGSREIIRVTSTELDSLHHTADVTFRLWTLEGKTLLDSTVETHRMRYFFPREFELLLAQAGFGLVSLTAFPSLDRAPSDDNWNVVAVAQAR